MSYPPCATYYPYPKSMKQVLICRLKALLIAQEQTLFAEIRRCIRGIVFLGTPHDGGPNVAIWVKRLLTIGKASGFFRDDHHERLLPKAEELFEISSQSVEPLGKTRVLSMYERRKTNGIMVFTI
jgi:hypothetical protein